MRRVVACLALLLSLLACASGGSKKPASPAVDEGGDDPLYAFTLLRQGSILLQQKRYPEALKRFEHAAALTPTNTTVHNMTGLCHLQMGNLDEAIAAFDRALGLTPSFTDARNNRGSAYLAEGKYQLAEVDFLAVLADTTYPHRWEAYYNLGMAQLQQGRLAAAEESLRRAAFAPVPVYPAFLRLSEIALRQGRPDAAVALLEEARIKFPDRGEAALDLGRLLVQLGRPAEAREHLQAVVDANPSSTMADEARSLLNSL